MYHSAKSGIGVEVLSFQPLFSDGEKISPVAPAVCLCVRKIKFRARHHHGWARFGFLEDNFAHRILSIHLPKLCLEGDSLIRLKVYALDTGFSIGADNIWTIIIKVFSL